MRHLLHILMAYMTVAVLYGCDLESSDNGKLDGFWHLEQVDTLATDGTADLSGQRLFWSFQGKIMMLNDMNYGLPECVANFDHSNGKLTVSSPLLSDRTKGDPKITDASVLAPYGINGLEEQFEVERMTCTRMTLRSKRVRLNFRKF